MTLTPTSSRGIVPAAERNRESARNAARGFYVQNYPYQLATGGYLPTSQLAVFALVGADAGDTISGGCFIVNTAGTSTKPTAIYAGLYDTSGNRLAVSLNVASAAQGAGGSWAVAQPIQVPFVTPYTIAVTGGYYVAFVQDGSWAGTAMQLGRVGGGGWDATFQGQSPTVYTQAKMAAQATLPTTAVYADSTSDQNIWAGWY